MCKQPDIKRKFPDSRRITAPDANGNSISVSDIVTIKGGTLAGKTGTAKHIVRGSVYLQSREVTQHGGFICLRSRELVVKGARAAGVGAAARPDPSRLLRSPAPHRIAYGPLRLLPHVLPCGNNCALCCCNGRLTDTLPSGREMVGNGGPVLASPMRTGGFGGSGGARGGGRSGTASFSGRGMPYRDRIVGKSITIAKGPYKCVATSSWLGRGSAGVHADVWPDTQGLQGEGGEYDGDARPHGAGSSVQDRDGSQDCAANGGWRSAGVGNRAASGRIPRASHARVQPATHAGIRGGQPNADARLGLAHSHAPGHDSLTPWLCGARPPPSLSPESLPALHMLRADWP